MTKIGWQRELLLALATVSLLVASLHTADAEEAVVAPATDESVWFSAPTAAGTISYAPGRGLHFGDTGLSVGGYSSINFMRPEGDPAELNLDELSFFLIWNPLPRFHAFSEVEVEDLVRVYTDGDGGFSGADIQVERLYGDVDLADDLTLRTGKFLTPVGRWNEIHAPPLVWTTTRPLVTDLPFDDYVTGFMLFGTLFPQHGSVTYNLFGQFIDQFASIDQRFEAERSVGARIEYSAIPGASTGATYLAFRDQKHRWHQLGGFDVAAERGPIELMGELIVQDVEHYHGTEWGFYVQGAFEAVRSFYVIARYEYFAPVGDSQVHLIDPGIAYRPVPYAVAKLEYRIADRHVDYAPGGFFSSLALLF